MSNIIDFKNQKVSSAFAHLKVNKSLSDGITAGGFPILNIRGKTWSLRYQGQIYKFLRPDDGTPLTYLDLVILNVADTTSRIYFPEWNGEDGGSEGPLCASIKGDVPDAGVPQPQHKNCAACPRSQWSTKPSGKRTPECQLHKRLAVLLMPAMTKKMMGSPLKEPVYLKVPPGSLGTLKTYGDMLDHANLHYAAVLTRVSFDPVKLFQINFDLKQTLTDEEAPLVLPLIEDPRTKRIIGEVPVIREIKPAIAAAPERVNTGLLEAYNDEPEPPVVSRPIVRPMPPPDPVQEIEQEIIAPPRKRGRPPKAEAQPVKDDGGVMATYYEQPRAIDNDMDQEDAAVDVPGDTMKALHDRVAAALNKKTDDMLK